MTVDGRSSMSDRTTLRREFVAGTGWADASESLLAGDASFRKYFRLVRPSGTAVVMDAPPPQEDVRPFVRIGRHLRALGLSAPEIHAVDAEHGFLLLEDLGDDTYARVIERGGDERMIYERATDVLAVVHSAPNHGLLPDLGTYMGDGLIDAAMLLPEWYLPAATGRPTPTEEIENYRAAWKKCLSHLPEAAGDTLLLRDYHKDNLLWLPERPGVRACGLLDFQDAQRGHASYDLVSLIEDARRDVSPAIHAACLERYVGATGIDPGDFNTGFALMAAQRHARIIGLFVRLLERDGKPDYLPHLPRVWRMFERALTHEAVAPLRAWVDRLLPPSLRHIGAA